MGCLNGKGQFTHWFGNVHLSGPCNRSCYFCIGQHMMALDSYNVLDTWPLSGIDRFLADCTTHNVKAVYVTGTNTDPLLYKHTPELVACLRSLGIPVGVRTNGVQAEAHRDRWDAYDCGSITVCSLNADVNQTMMGGPPVRNLGALLISKPDVKVNIVLGPENREDVYRTLDGLMEWGPRRVNLREPYGQPHIGNPMRHTAKDMRHGMPIYAWGPLEVCYWDVHFVEVESVNLYASGRVSLTYPITKGHHESGQVFPQSAFPGGRVNPQWIVSPEHGAAADRATT